MFARYNFCHAPIGRDDGGGGENACSQSAGVNSVDPGLNPLFPRSSFFRTSNTRRGADVPARALSKSERKETKVAGRERGGSNFALRPLFLSLLFFVLSLFRREQDAETRLICVTIRHSILLYSSAYVLRRFDSEAGARKRNLRYTPTAKSPAFRHSHPIRGVCECARGIKYARLNRAYTYALSARM